MNNVARTALEDLLVWLEERCREGDGPLWNGGPPASQYRAGLLRPTGSYVEGLNSLEDLRALFDRLELREAEVPAELRAPGYTYWRADVPEPYRAFEAAVFASELEDGELAQVRLVRGAHGLELRAPGLPCRPAKQILVIVDPDGRLATWYPGRPGSAIDVGRVMVKLER